MLEETNQNVLIGAPIVAGLVQGAKINGLPVEYASSAAMIFSFGVVSLLVDDPTSREAALTAIIMGLTASGLYSQAKYYTDKLRNEEDEPKLPELPA